MDLPPAFHDAAASFGLVKKETQDTRAWVSLLFGGLIVLVVVVSGGAAYAIFKEPEPTPKRTASSKHADRGADEARARDATKSDEGEARGNEADKAAKALARYAGAMAESDKQANGSDEDVTWKPAPWGETAEREKAAPTQDWTPKGIAALDPQGLVESIRGERNQAARRKLMQELLSRGLSSPQVAEYVQNNPDAIVDVIRTEPDQISRARLADQISEVELPPAAKEDTAVELLLLPDGSLKVTAMEMLLGEPDSALSRLQERQSLEDDPERLVVIESAIAYLQKKQPQ